MENHFACSLAAGMAFDGAQVLSEVPDIKKKKILWPSRLKAGPRAVILTSKNSVVSKQWQKPRKGNGERRLELGFGVGTRHVRTLGRARTLKRVEGTSYMTSNYLLFIVQFVYFSTFCRYPYLNMIIVFFNLHCTYSQSKTDPLLIKCLSAKTCEGFKTCDYSFLTSTRVGSE